MLIGEDFDKIEWSFLGWDLLEPNAFIGDTILGVFVLVYFFKSRKYITSGPFFKNWYYTFFVLGSGFLIGGLGHLMYNYWGIPGKYYSWISGIVTSYFIEAAMVSLLKNKKELFKKLIVSKLILSLLALFTITVVYDLPKEPLKGLIVPTVSSFVGLLFALAYLGQRFTKEIGPHFKYLVWSVLVLLPSVVFQAFKINIHPWLDRNDVSHILLIVSTFLYFKAVVSHHNFVNKA